MVPKVMFGVQESSFIFYLVEYPHSGTVRLDFFIILCSPLYCGIIQHSHLTSSSVIDQRRSKEYLNKF